MSDKWAAIVGAGGVLLGGVVAGLFAIMTVHAQSETQLKILYASNAFSISTSMRPKAQEFTDASRGLLLWSGSKDFDATAKANLTEYLEKSDRAIAATNAISPYLSYSDAQQATLYVVAIRNVARSVKNLSSIDERISNSLSCRYDNLEILISKKLSRLDAAALPDVNEDFEQGSLLFTKLSTCE